MYYALMLPGVLSVHCVSDLNIMGWAYKTAEGNMRHQKFLTVFWNFLCVTWIIFQDKRPRTVYLPSCLPVPLLIIIPS